MATLKGADQGFADSVNKLMSETGVSLQSGYRDTANQTGLWNTKVEQLKKQGMPQAQAEQAARKWVAPPGGSNHEHGIAADIGGYDKITDQQLAKYGLWRPMSWEPWHVEPIGSRGKGAKGGGKAASTIPPVEDAVANVMANFGDAIAKLTMGEQNAMIGQQNSAVGQQGAGVGDQAGITPPTTEDPMTDATAQQDLSMGKVVGGGGAAGATGASTPANESAYADLFNSIGKKYGLSPKVLQEIARQESGFNPNAGSPAGAQGLMQFMPATAKGMGVNPMDPASAIDGAARYITSGIKEFGSLELALAAYNAGGGAVKKHGGIPPFKETQNYVKKIMAKVNS